MYKIKGKADSKHVTSAMQVDGLITYIQHSKICVQEATSQYNRTSDWLDKALLCKNHIIY